ncbi:MAG: hypothetical protein ABWX92_15495 [Mycetocola sp.]
MSTFNGRPHNSGKRLLPRLGAGFALLLGCVSLVGCNALETPSPVSTADPVTVSSLPDGGKLDPGTYLVNGFTVPFEITVPDGWESGGWFVYRSAPDDAGVAVNFQVDSYVPTDACAWKGTIVEVGPSLEAFASAMAAQTSTVTTPAVEIMLDGFTGLEFDHAVESNVDIRECDEQKICLHSDSASNCARWHSSVSEHETYRIVDLGGERAVIAVLSTESPDPNLVEEARAVFDSITFARDEQATEE